MLDAIRQEQSLSSYILRERKTEFLTRAEGDELIIEGYFVVFNQPYHIYDDFEEIVKREAFDDQTDMSDVRALTNHNTTLVLGRSTVNTLTFKIDEVGIYCTIRINAKDQDAVSTHARVQRGDVDQASFGFDADKITYVDLPDGRVRREITHVSKLWEFSVCTFPAYEQTYVSARARDLAEAAKVKTRNKIQNLKGKLKHA